MEKCLSQFGVRRERLAPVPDTGTAVWFELLQNRRSILLMPRRRRWSRMSKWRNDPNSIAEGKDQQLEKAAELLTKE
jgi:hypothetical protein